MLMARFRRTGGREMLKLMNEPMDQAGGAITSTMSAKALACIGDERKGLDGGPTAGDGCDFCTST
jgi:hypothetical protein